MGIVGIGSTFVDLKNATDGDSRPHVPGTLCSRRQHLLSILPTSLQGADIVVHSLTKYINGHSDVRQPRPKASLFQNARGAIPNKFDYWLAQHGARTFAVRMETHSLNALCIAFFLTSHPAEHVIYSGLASQAPQPAHLEVSQHLPAVDAHAQYTLR
ncbi:Cys/Met metabolism PLP-dependent enzyme-domain-containing protein [Suillus occidentalis]|nr:Cys/Met metabolism PLP-dependent enzyme-domain-containing protein [Suillus occidentalis]